MSFYRSTSLVAVGVLSLLAACGGGGDAAAPTLTTRTVSVATTGTGTGTVSSSPTGITCGTTCSGTFPTTAAVTLTAAPGPQSSFAGWTGPCSGTSTCSIPAGATAASVGAQFTLDSYLLTVILAGTGSGSVTSSPAGITCGSDCTESYSAASVVTLTASASVGSSFTGWSGGGCTGTGTCTVTISAATTVTATFTAITHVLSVTKIGVGTGTITSAPSGIACGSDCTEAYVMNTSVTLTAVPDPTSSFVGWSGGGCSGTGPCTISMTAATSVSAQFGVFVFRWPDSPNRACSTGTTAAVYPAGLPGQDGAYTINVPTYTVIGGRVLDGMTGLVWQRSASVANFAQAAAMTACDNLVLDGFDDWRLPSFLELLSIVDFGSVGPAFDRTAFPGIPQNSTYWTTTERNGASASAMVFGTNYATLSARLKTEEVGQLARCVRGTPISGSFTSAGGSVTDSRTQLVWQSDIAPSVLDWSSALAYCEALTLDGNSDWRLPSGKELMSVLDFTQTTPTIAPVFSARPTTTFWSSSPLKGFENTAYAIRFAFGSSDDIGTSLTSTRSVRCVRGG
jgi:hypothetical protein